MDEDTEVLAEAEPADAGMFGDDMEEGGGGRERKQPRSIPLSIERKTISQHSQRGVTRVNSTMTSEFTWVFASPKLRKLRIFFKH